MRRSAGDHRSRGASEPQEPPARVAFVASGYLFIGLLALVAGLILGLASVKPPAPQPASVSSDRFSAEAALPLVLRLLGDTEPHPSGTEANSSLRQRLIAELTALELEVTTQEAFACRERWLTCGNVVNVMARLPGESDGPAVLLTAHYDSVGAGPGVSDDLTGVVAILEAARLLLNQPPLRNPFILLFTDGEELGLLGAEAFATHPWLDEVGVIVNVEARGTAGQSTLFETSENNAWLLDAFAGQARRPVANSVLYEIYRLLPNDTDFSVYKEAGKAGVNFAYFDEVAHYHTPNDDLAHLSRASFQHHGDNLLAAARAFAELDLAQAPAGNSLYLDLVPGTLVRVPLGWAVPLALVALLLWLVLLVVLLRRGLFDWLGLVLGVAATLLALALAGVLGYGVVEAIATITGRDYFFYAEPVATRAAVWLAAFLGVHLGVVPLARRAGFWGLCAGVWLTWSLAGLATAIALPGASVFFLVPLLASATLFGGVLATPLWRTVWAGPLAAAVASLVTAYLWLPFVLGLESGLGLEFAPAIAVCAALAFTSFAPLLAQPRGHGQGRAALTLAAVAALGVTGVMAATAQTFTEDRPQRLNFLHLQTAVDGQPQGAKWLVDAFPPPTPTTELATAARFVEDTTVTLPWTGARFRSAEGPLLDHQAPGLTVLADEPTGAGRVLTLELTTAREVQRLSLVVPAAANLRRIVVPDTPYDMEVPAGEENTVFTCHGSGCGGTVLELHLAEDPAAAAPQQLTFSVVDLSYGLPAEGAELLEARPENAAASQDGDVSVVVNRVSVTAP